MVKDEWVRAAMTDEKLVVELLVRLKQAQAAAPSKRQAVIPVRWGIRLPRSRPPTRSDVGCRRKGGDSTTRCSPTTPLSWSGGGGDGDASPSATADGYEETSRHTDGSPSGIRSKGNATVEMNSTTIKRSRRKKTFAELKEQESLLLKERVYLRKELATLYATVEEQRARNENLKRMKPDFNLHDAKDSILAIGEPKQASCHQSDSQEVSSTSHIRSTLQTHVEGDNHPGSDSSETCNSVSNHDRFFLLPDLNMVPAEDDSGTETLFGEA